MWKPIFQETRLNSNLLPISTLFTSALKAGQQFWEGVVTHIYGQGDQISLCNHNWGYGILKHHLPSLYTHAIDADITLKEAKHCIIMLMFQQVLTIEASDELLLLRGYLAGVVIAGAQA